MFPLLLSFIARHLSVHLLLTRANGPLVAQEFFGDSSGFAKIRHECTPVKKIYNVYGINRDTEAGYIFNLKKQQVHGS